MHSKKKGKRGELDFAHFLEDLGFAARRGWAGGLDCICEQLDTYHFEVKYRERLNIYEAFNQARTDAGVGKIPVVCFRKNRGTWMAALSAKDFFALVKRAQTL